MRCILIENPGPEGQLVLREQPKPLFSDEEMLVKVHATALNRADLLQRAGKYPPPAGASNIPGLEVAGVVVEKGPNVLDFEIGDRVYGLVSGGGYAEYCAVHRQLAQKIPDDWSFTFAAAIPEALVTAHATAIELGSLSPKQTFLIHGAGSGIATTAIQMAKLLNTKILTTIGDEKKRSHAQQIGATHVFNYKNEPWYDKVEESSVNVVVDFIGGDYFSKHLKLLAKKGHLIQIACMQNHRIEASLIPILQKRLTLHGFVLRSQTVEEKSELWHKAHTRWHKFYLDGQIKPIIDSCFKLQDIEKAHKRMRSSTHFGKIVIEL